MDIIMNYIDSMFAGVPVTDETRRLREDITANMCDKFEELTKEGKSVNEAIGTVIAEFGSIDEVLSEMGVERVKPAAPVVVKSVDPAVKYRRALQSCCLLGGLGAGMTLTGISWVSEYGVRGYSFTGMGAIGLMSLIAGLVLIIISVLARTRLITNADSIPGEVIASLKARYEKNAAVTTMIDNVTWAAGEEPEASLVPEK